MASTAKSYVEDLLQTKVYYTIGSLNMYGEPCFELTEEKIDAYLGNDIFGKRPFKAHVWLTLPSMEIIDLTQPTIHLIETEDFEGYASIRAEHTDDLQEKGMIYTPMLVGKQFMYEIGCAVKFG